jgi:hypothetical protein
VLDLKLWTGESFVGRLVSRVVMFHAVCYGWLLFRANSFEQIRSFTAALLSGFRLQGLNLAPSAALLALLVLVLWGIESWIRNADDPRGSLGWRAGAGPLVCAFMAVAIVVLAPPIAQSFIYFQF